MSLFTEWVVRIAPPRSGAVRALAANGTSQVVELDTDILQFTNASVSQPLGRVLVTLEADGADVYVLFGQTNGVVANSAATSASNAQTTCLKVQANVAPVRFELSPQVDKFMAYQCANGSNTTATLRYYVSSFPQQSSSYGA